MSYDYIPGILDFLNCLRKNDVKTAIVTSSNDVKMATLYREHPDIKSYFDVLVTANQISRSAIYWRRSYWMQIFKIVMSLKIL